MKQNHIFCTLLALLMICAAGCIKNDIPYPHTQPNFLTFNVADQDAGVLIDSASRVVTVRLTESSDIRNVVVTDYTLTPESSIVDNILNNPLDLTEPVSVVLRLYQDWTWTIKGLQNIERYFEVEGQMGATEIDAEQHLITVQMRESADLTNVRITRAKLSNVGSIITPDIAEGGTLDCTQPVVLSVEAFGRAEEWTLNVETVKETVRTVSFTAWTCVAWVEGLGEAGADNGVQYRLKGETAWNTVPASEITHNAGSFVARISHLNPESTYEARAISGNDSGVTLEATTGPATVLPNGDFENWWKDGKVWCPWTEDGEPYWGTGNKGATTLGESNTQPTTDTPSGFGWAAKLETRYVGVSILGKLAAGNIFTGTYVRTDGTNGVLAFGRPFTERPTKLKGMLKYSGVDMTHGDTDHKYLIGQPDTAIVWVALIDSDEPFEIRTNPKNRQLFDPEGPEVIAYGRMLQSDAVDQWTPFEFELEYKSTSRVPKYIIVTASASMYGDYFTGGNGSVLYIDDFELEYDY